MTQVLLSAGDQELTLVYKFEQAPSLTGCVLSKL